MSPFFSVGVTTYDRLALLKETIASIRAQNFTDFEVLIGNDLVTRTLTPEALDLVGDDRFRIINHPKNLGEWGNMNRLLELAQGKYFTWLADDDLYAPFFLANAHRAISEGARVVYGNFQAWHGGPAPALATKGVGEYRRIPAARFAADALAYRVPAIGSMGVYEIDLLRELGGYVDVSEHPAGRGLFGEYMLFLKAATAVDEVVYFEKPQAWFRDHATSFSFANQHVELRRQAGTNLVRKAVPALRHPRVQPLASDIMHSLMKIALGSVADVSLRDPAFFEAKLPLALRALRLDRVARAAGLPDSLSQSIGRTWKRAWLETLASHAWPVSSRLVKRIVPAPVLKTWRAIRKNLVSPKSSG
ncbi:MAG: glycosyltransferase family 2 protein [Bacteriovoracia bacterium]